MTDTAEDPLSRALQALTRALDADPPPSRRVNLGMKFGAEMNDPPAPRLARLTPNEERVLRMRFGISMNTDSEPEEKP